MSWLRCVRVVWNCQQYTISQDDLAHEIASEVNDTLHDLYTRKLEIARSRYGNFNLKKVRMECRLYSVLPQLLRDLELSRVKKRTEPRCRIESFRTIELVGSIVIFLVGYAERMAYTFYVGTNNTFTTTTVLIHL